MKSTNVLEGAKEAILQKKALIEMFRTYRLEPTGDVTVSTEEYKELLEGIEVKDITSLEQYNLGITVLHVKASKETDFGKHDHKKQSQVIYVMKGQIYDLQANIMFSPGQSFLVPKSNIHTIRYYPNTEAVVVYMPKLFLV